MPKDLLPYLVNIPGGIVMAIALYGFYTGKILTKGAKDEAVSTWKGLYEALAAKSSADIEKLEVLNDGLIRDLSTQNASHLETIRLLERFIPIERDGAQGAPRRRRNDAG